MVKHMVKLQNIFTFTVVDCDRFKFKTLHSRSYCHLHVKKWPQKGSVPSPQQVSDTAGIQTQIFCFQTIFLVLHSGVLHPASWGWGTKMWLRLQSKGMEAPIHLKGMEADLMLLNVSLAHGSLFLSSGHGATSLGLVCPLGFVLQNFLFWVITYLLSTYTPRTIIGLAGGKGFHLELW